MPMKKPTFFTKVIQALSQLSANRGFTIKQISDHLRKFGVKKDPKEVREIVEQSLKYGIKTKFLQENGGKYNLTPAKLKSFPINKPPVQDNTKKRVRFKRTKVNIPDNKNLKSKKNKKNTRKGSILKEEKQEPKEPLDVTPDKDTHDNCTNKNKDRSKQPNLREPPRLVSEQDIIFEPPRPSNKIIRNLSPGPSTSKVIRRTPPRPSKARLDEQSRKYFSSLFVEQEKYLKNLIPDDKNYRKHKLRARHHSYNNISNSEDECTRSCKERKYTCPKHCYHHSHYNLNDFALKRKDSNSVLRHLNLNKYVGEHGKKFVTPFEIFLGSKQLDLETIPERMVLEDIPEETEEETNIPISNNSSSKN